MTGRELHALWIGDGGMDRHWGFLLEFEADRWNRLAAEVVPVSEVAAWLRSQTVVTGPLVIAAAFEARFAPRHRGGAMTHADAMRRLATCRENQPDAMQVLVSADIVDALLAAERERGLTITELVEER